ncbi:MAG: hypothetical protein DYG99_03450 [Bacteroidetes bacterium CHB5]|nr:hypothetical protein [Bacteroidetes bacterium CHB5]
MNTSYTPITYDCRDLLQEAVAQGRSGKIFFFNADNQLDSVEGRIEQVLENKEGMFVCMVPTASIRVDRIITLYGKPFAAYDEYDAYANTCLDCKGGYEME